MTANTTENKFIRALFRKHYPEVDRVSYYNDLRTTGRRRVFKTDEYNGSREGWVNVLKDLQESIYSDRWVGWESSDECQVGIKRHESR